MGNAASRPEDEAVTEKLAHRLRAMEIESQRLREQVVEKDEYVNVTRQSEQPRETGISLSTTEDWKKTVLQDPKNLLALSAFSGNAANDILRSPSAVNGDTQIFNHKIPHEGAPITNQKRSGRCWLFASCNVYRIAYMERLKLKEFELSQAYLFFWDKLEKANYFLENVLDTVDEELDGRLLQTLLADPVSDGGQWDMQVNITTKYGLVPKDLYPDAFSAANSSLMDKLITDRLREDALRLRTLASHSDPAVRSSVAGVKEGMMAEIHRILTLMLGPPPSPTEKFSWEYYDKDGSFHSLSMTPKEFAGLMSDKATVRALNGVNPANLFSLVNDPRNPYMTRLTVSRLGNVWNGRPVTYVNVNMSTLKNACITMIKKGMPVWFGCDVGQSSDSTRGIMDSALYDYELGFNVKLGLTKVEGLQTGQRMMTHAMVLTAVHIDEKTGKSVRWRVENSWSETAGDKGYFVMTDGWMDQFVFQAVVDPCVVSDEVKKVLQQKPKKLNLWDPMGTLA